MRVRLRGIAVFVLMLSGASCGRACARDDAGGAAPAASASASASANAFARCTAGAPVRFGAAAEDAGESEGPLPYGAEIGGAAADANAFTFGARTAGLGGVAQVLRIPHGGGAPTVLVTVPSKGPARPPLVSVAAGRVLVGAMEIDADARTFRVFSLGEGKLAPLGEVVQQKDESEFTAMVPTSDGALVAWDDADEKAGIGRVRVRRLPSKPTNEGDAGKQAEKDAGDAGAVAEDVVSPPSSDAAWPLFVLSPKGDRAALLWVAERPEGESDGGGEPSQQEAYRWVEGVVLDVASGKPLGAPRALTASSGHAQTIAAAWVDGGLVVAVRDDPRPTDGDGGELSALRVPIADAGAMSEPSRVVIAEKDVSPGVAFVVARGSGAWISWLTQSNEARLSPAFVAGDTSVEPALANRQVVAAFDDALLATRISGRALELVTAHCAR